MIDRQEGRLFYWSNHERVPYGEFSSDEQALAAFNAKSEGEDDEGQDDEEP